MVRNIDKEQHISGFTLVEFLLVVILIVLTLSSGAFTMSNFFRSSQLSDSVDQTLVSLRIARENAAAKKNNQSHGVYFEINPSSPDRVIRYQGSDYSTRNVAYDSVMELSTPITISTTLTGNQVNFAAGTGIPDNTGIISITHSERGSNSISINSFGLVEAN